METEIKMIRQRRLTSECWLVQVWGLNQCKTCEAKNTLECGGLRIRQTGKNELDISVPIN